MPHISDFREIQLKLNSFYQQFITKKLYSVLEVYIFK